jgi:hypothetical protein
MGNLSRVIGAITGSTAISATVAIISIWMCWAERTDKNMIWKASCLMAVLGILGIVFTIREELVSQDEATEASRELMESQMKVAELLALNKAMASRIASRADILTVESRRALTAKFAVLPPGSVGVARVDVTSESKEFADVIEKILGEAGCLGARLDLTVGTMDRGSPGRVVVTLLQGDESKSAADLIATALTEAGIPDVVIGSGIPGARVGKLVQLTIKPR